MIYPLVNLINLIFMSEMNRIEYKRELTPELDIGRSISNIL